MIVREYNWSDIDEVSRIHKAQNLGYELPDLFSPMLVVKKVAMEGSEIVGAAFLRLTSEAYVVIDPEAEKRAKIFFALHENVRQKAALVGLDDVNAWLPPQMADKFGHQIMRLGWKRQQWPSFSREVR